MNRYFDLENSLSVRLGERAETAITAVAQRYIGQNPPEPYRMRVYDPHGFRWEKNGELRVDFLEKFPQAAHGQMAWAAGRLWLESAQTMLFTIRCRGPMRVCVNGTEVFRSGMAEDIDPARRVVFPAALRAGWNDFALRGICTASGFGGWFALDNARWTWRNFLAPFQERRGQLGFVYSQLFEGEEPVFPAFDFSGSEKATGLCWHPVQQATPLDEWCKADEGDVAFARAWPTPEETSPDAQREAFFTLRYHGGHWQGLSLPCRENGSVLPSAPEQAGWLFIGPFAPERCPGKEELSRLDRVYQTRDGKRYWRTLSGLAVRPSFEAALFGRWNYPVGVTLYGLLKAGCILRREDIWNYARQHILQCVRYTDYSVWDRDVYGFPAVNNQLASLEMLDDCGSFGLAMMELSKTLPPQERSEILAVASRIAEYIEHRQERQPDGAFYRDRPGSISKNTMWADDLFMSTPFLARYAQATGEQGCLDDAARQFLLFKSYLYMPEKRLMSHIYSFAHKAKTQIAWGRGNGWVLFSLAEVLLCLPQEHPQYDALLSFFCELSEGLLHRQDEQGLWHQVLDDPTSYAESSCTAMFVYAFCVGVRQGWYGDRCDVFARAAHKAWRGLCRNAVDAQGNVHGVCQGSGYSFLPGYYKNELHTVCNDTHGIGIFLLAAVEIAQLSA